MGQALNGPCVRCESKENISPYRHKTPPISFTKSRKNYTKITTIVGTGGTGIVPACKQCKKLFSRWKVLHGLTKFFFITSWVVFGLYLVFLLVVPDPFTSKRIKFIYSRLPTILSGISTLIFGVAFIYFKISKSDPHKYITTNYGVTMIKSINADKWHPILTK